MKRDKATQSGFTLIELMVALVIGLLVIAGAIQIFVMTSRSFNELDMLSSRQESIRFITDVIGVDVRTSREIFSVEYYDKAVYQSCALPDDDDENEEVVVSGIALEYGVEAEGRRRPREDDPYCSPNGTLDRVIYFTGSSPLSMCVVCDGDGGRKFSLQEDAKIENKSLVPGESVKLSIEFEDEMKARGAVSEFTLVFTSRDSISSFGAQ